MIECPGSFLEVGAEVGMDLSWNSAMGESTWTDGLQLCESTNVADCNLGWLIDNLNWRSLYISNTSFHQPPMNRCSCLVHLGPYLGPSSCMLSSRILSHPIVRCWGLNPGLSCIQSRHFATELSPLPIPMFSNMVTWGRVNNIIWHMMMWAKLCNVLPFQTLVGHWTSQRNGALQ